MKFNSYNCSVIDRNGNKKRIIVQGESKNAVMQSFRGTDYIPLDVKLQSDFSLNKNNKKTAKSLLEFTKIMEQLIASGLSMKDALEVAAMISDNKKESSLIANKLLEQIQKGITFADAVNNMTNIFPSVYRGIIAVGNRIGSVENIFPRLRIYLETTKKIKDKFMGALAYPLMVLITAVFGVLAMAVFVFPKLQEMFAEFGGDAAKLLQNNIYKLKIIALIFFAVIILLILIIFVIQKLSKSNKKIKETIDAFVLKIPFINKLVIYWNTLNFSFAMETLTTGGVTVEAAIPESQSVVTNSVYNNALSKITDDIIKGVSLSKAFSLHKIFPEYMTKWLLVGEKSGNTEEVFGQIRNYFQNAVEKYVSTFMALIEPTLIVIIGIVILLFVVTIVVPIFSLYGSIL